uniref:RING-type domain-containing protein n=1 Tax=Globodera rostochiensis TaxID=31243 RepID=A0A914IER0_GLORO
MSECLCFVCNSPVLNNLAMLCKCNHVAGHATCVTPFVTQHGRCPVPNCAQPAVASDVLVLCIDPPQPNGFSQVSICFFTNFRDTVKFHKFALLRKYFSEIVVSGSMGAFFSTLAFGIKKIVD